MDNILATLAITRDTHDNVTHLSWGEDLSRCGGDPLFQQVHDYLLGERTAFDITTAFTSGTPFQQEIWHALKSIPYGTTITYKQLAEKVNSHPRAVASAVGKNPMPIIIPCHRVVAQNGLGGYSAGNGADTKRQLLKLEGITL